MLWKTMHHCTMIFLPPPIMKQGAHSANVQRENQLNMYTVITAHRNAIYNGQIN